MKLADLERFRNRGLCADGLNDAYALLGAQTEYATARALAEAYICAGGDVANVLRVLLLLAPDSASAHAAAWTLARITFEVLPAPLRGYAETLGPDNWREAHESAHAAAHALAREERRSAAAYTKEADFARAAQATRAAAIASRAAVFIDSDDLVPVRAVAAVATAARHAGGSRRIVAIVLNAVEAI